MLNKFFIILVSFCLMLSGCSTFQNPVNYVAPSAYLTAMVVLDKADSPEDRHDKAVIIYDVSEVIYDLTNDGAPSTLEFQMALDQALPDKLHWDIFAANIALVYEKTKENEEVYDKTEKASKILNKIADGLNSAANLYL